MDEKQTAVPETTAEAPAAQQPVATTAEPVQAGSSTAKEEPPKKKKKKKSAGKTVGKIIFWLVLIALVILATLFIVAKIAQFESIGALVDYLIYEFRALF